MCSVIPTVNQTDNQQSGRSGESEDRDSLIRQCFYLLMTGEIDLEEYQWRIDAIKERLGKKG